MKKPKLQLSISTIKTNIDKLNDVLWRKLTENLEVMNIYREQFVAPNQIAFEEYKNELKETPSFRITYSIWTNFIGQ